jgi:putative transposase
MYKTYQLKIVKNDYFNLLFREAKWYYNTVLASEDVFNFDTKEKIAFLTPEISQETTILSSQMRQEIKKLLCSSVKGLSQRKKRGYKVGKLKFKGFLNALPLKNQTFKLSKNRIRFQGCKKSFKIRGYQQLPENYVIKSGVLIRNPDGIYLKLVIEEADQPVIIPTKIIGIDMGVKDSLTFSDGTKLNTIFAESEQEIKKLHRKLSKKEKGSKNRLKARAKLGKAYHKLDKRKDDVSKKVLNKLKSYQVYFQDEMVTGWRRLFGRQIQHSILGRIKSGLKSNPETNVCLAKTIPTTKFCPECAVLNDIPLSQRIYRCECRYQLDRDIHSARNMIIIGSGRAYVEQGTSVFDELVLIGSKFLVLKQEANGL